MRKRRLNYRLITGFKSRFRIRDAASLFFVEKVESHDIESTRGQTCSSHAHEAAQLVRAGAVTKDDSHTRALPLRGRIKQRRDASEFVYRNFQFFSFHRYPTRRPKKSTEILSRYTRAD